MAFCHADAGQRLARSRMRSAISAGRSPSVAAQEKVIGFNRIPDYSEDCLSTVAS